MIAQNKIINAEYLHIYIIFRRLGWNFYFASTLWHKSLFCNQKSYSILHTQLFWTMCTSLCVTKLINTTIIYFDVCIDCSIQYEHSVTLNIAYTCRLITGKAECEREVDGKTACQYQEHIPLPSILCWDKHELPPKTVSQCSDFQQLSRDIHYS